MSESNGQYSSGDAQDDDAVAAVPPGSDELAAIAQRIAARFIDWFLLNVVWLLLAGATSERLEDDGLSVPRWAVVTWILLVIVYEAGFVAWRGQTPGKQIVGIKLVAATTGATPSMGASLVRVAPVGAAIAVLSQFFPVVMVFVYFSAGFMKDSRGLLDLLAGTAVVKTR